MATAKKLLRDSPSDSDIRRAVSTAYYALFHHLCSLFSEIVLHPDGSNFEMSHLQAYRYMDHGSAKTRCSDKRILRNFPAGIGAFAEAFVDLQIQRSDADYDPSRRFTENEVSTAIGDAERAIAALESESIEVKRAFAIFVALKPNRRS